MVSLSGSSNEESNEIAGFYRLAPRQLQILQLNGTYAVSTWKPAAVTPPDSAHFSSQHTRHELIAVESYDIVKNGLCRQ